MNKVRFVIQSVAYWSKANGHSERFTRLISTKTGESIYIPEHSGNINFYIGQVIENTCYPVVVECRESWESYSDYTRLYKLHNIHYIPETEIIEWIKANI